MNTDPHKITEVIIRDETGKVVDSFQFGMIGTTKYKDKTMTLEIQKHPKGK